MRCHPTIRLSVPDPNVASRWGACSAGHRNNLREAKRVLAQPAAGTLVNLVLKSCRTELGDSIYANKCIHTFILTLILTLIMCVIVYYYLFIYSEFGLILALELLSFFCFFLYVPFYNLAVFFNFMLLFLSALISSLCYLLLCLFREFVSLISMIACTYVSTHFFLLFLFLLPSSLIVVLASCCRCC